jgi:predicted metal-dependent HD superfamily phosphohydrolase
MTRLDVAWDKCFDDLGVARPPPAVFDDLLARYDEPHRAYHTRQHLEECFGWFAQARPLMRAPGEVALALFYHDAIYDTHASDNEARSAVLARSVHDSTAVEALIMATKHDVVAPEGDAQVLIDIDLSILGAAPARFDEYEQQVREEYAWVATDAFREGRSGVLRQFAARARIYETDFFSAHLEAAARSNLARSLAKLAA